MSTNTIGNNDASIIVMENHLNSTSSSLSIQGNCLITSAIDPAKRYRFVSISHEGKNIRLNCQEEQAEQIRIIAREALTSNNLTPVGHKSKTRLLKAVSKMPSTNALSSPIDTVKELTRQISTSLQNFRTRLSSSSTSMHNQQSAGFNDSGIDSPTNQFQKILDNFDESFKSCNQQIDALIVNVFNFTEDIAENQNLERSLSLMNELTNQKTTLEQHIKELKTDFQVFSQNYTQESDKLTKRFHDENDDTVIILSKGVADLKTTKDAIFNKLRRAEAELIRLNNEARIVQLLIEPSITTLRSIPNDVAANIIFDVINGQLTTRPIGWLDKAAHLLTNQYPTFIKVSEKITTEIHTNIDGPWLDQTPRNFGILCTKESAAKIQSLITTLNTQTENVIPEAEELRSQIERLSLPHYNTNLLNH